ncbi:hypothetical protein RUM44_001169 [Polyplax serrata]|uniref:Uncharacterized protein n=1 Tax=Polyplax serrata TaxID=468196 RepID=A0ABR1B6S8_POLSC
MVGVTAPALKKSTSTTGGGPLGIGKMFQISITLPKPQKKCRILDKRKLQLHCSGNPPPPPCTETIGDLQNGKDKFSLGGVESGQRTRENGTDWMRTYRRDRREARKTTEEPVARGRGGGEKKTMETFLKNSVSTFVKETHPADF